MVANRWLADSDIDFREAQAEDAESHHGHGEDCIHTVWCRRCDGPREISYECSGRVLEDEATCVCQSDEEE